VIRIKKRIELVQNEVKEFENPPEEEEEVKHFEPE
jgi:hypothetical protein